MGGAAPALTFVSLKPVFDGGRREKGYLIVLVAAAADSLNKAEAYRVAQIAAMDPILAKRQQAFSISAIDAKRIHRQIYDGTISIEQGYTAIRKAGALKSVHK